MSRPVSPVADRLPGGQTTPHGHSGIHLPPIDVPLLARFGRPTLVGGTSSPAERRPSRTELHHHTRHCHCRRCIRTGSFRFGMQKRGNHLRVKTKTMALPCMAFRVPRHRVFFPSKTAASPFRLASAASAVSFSSNASNALPIALRLCTRRMSGTTTQGALNPT